MVGVKSNLIRTDSNAHMYKEKDRNLRRIWILSHYICDAWKENAKQLTFSVYCLLLIDAGASIYLKIISYACILIRITVLKWFWGQQNHGILRKWNITKWNAVYFIPPCLSVSSQSFVYFTNLIWPECYHQISSPPYFMSSFAPLPYFFSF